jgi:hypothetical protein
MTMILTLMPYAAGAAIVGTLVFTFGRKRARWFSSELPLLAAGMVIPWVVLSILMTTTMRPKSLGNLGDFFTAGILAGLYPLARVFWGSTSTAVKINVFAVIVVAALVAILYFLLPPFPETGQG